MRNWKRAALALLTAGMLTLCACGAKGGSESISPADGSHAAADPRPAVSSDGWHCEELFHTKIEEPLRIPPEQEAADRETLNVYNIPLELTDDWMIRGWFDQDVSIAIGNASDISESARGKTSYADAEYGDTWYFDISDPGSYVHGLPERLMPDFIRISYMPKGSIIVNERECILITFTYYNEARDAVSDSMGYTYFNGPDTTSGWNWEVSTSE